MSNEQPLAHGHVTIPDGGILIVESRPLEPGETMDMLK